MFQTVPDLKLLLNQRCFLISGMVNLSSGLCSNILDNRPDQKQQQKKQQLLNQRWSECLYAVVLGGCFLAKVKSIIIEILSN